jgi:DNA-binding CsgD family transcriptional regulator
MVARAKTTSMGNSPHGFERGDFSCEDVARQIAASTRPAAALLGGSSSGTSDILAAIRQVLSPARTFYVRCARSANGVDAPFDALVCRMLESGTLSREWRDLAQESIGRVSDLRDAFAIAAAQRPLIVQFDDLHLADDTSLSTLEYCIDRLQDYPVRWFLAASSENALLETIITRLSGSDLLVPHRLGQNDTVAAQTPSLQMLTDDERVVVVALAAADRAMDDESLGHVLRFSRERVLRALQGAERAGMVRPEPFAYAIAGSQIRDMSIRTAEAWELRSVHHTLARIESDPVRRAAHLEDGGAPDEATPQYLEAAFDALACGRFRIVGAACDGVLRTAENDSPAQRAAQALAELMRRVSRTRDDEIVHVGRACLDELFGTLPLGDRVRCESAYYTSAIPFVSERAGEVQAIAKLLHLCGKNAVAGTAPLYWILAKLYYGSNQLECARDASERGLETLLHEYDPRNEVRLHISLGFILAAEGDGTGAIDLIERQIARARALGLTEEFYSACCAAMYVFATLGRFDDAAKWGNYALEEPGPKSTVWTSYLAYNMASIDLMLGHPERALGRLTMLRSKPAAPRSPETSMLMLLESTALLQINRFEAAAGVLSDALRLESAEWIRLELRNTQAILDELRGHPEEALQNATFVMHSKGEDSNAIRSRIAAATVVARLRCRLGWLDFADPASICLEARERVSVAAAAWEEVSAYAALAKNATDENARGLAAATSANPDRFARALNVFEAGKAAAQEDLLAQAAAEFEAIGSPVLARRARREAAARGLTLATRVSRRRHLTAREAELARHVASGKTNAEIGRILGLSTKTVGHHLSNILGKCGVRSRVEIAALVIRGTLPIGEAI